MNFDFTLVMTAAVNVNGMGGISRESIDGREDQYIRTLRFYVGQKCVPRVLFVENSNWDLSRIKREVNSHKVTYLSLDENNYPREWGKGHGEFLIMDHAVNRLILDGGGVFVKVTGRFPIFNIQTMIEEFAVRNPLLLSVDVVEHKLNKLMRINDGDSGCRTIIYACDCQFYMETLHGRYREIPERFWGAEALMRDVWNRNKDRKGVYARFKHEPRLSGFGGVRNYCWLTANNYDSALACFKRGVRQLCRWFLPNLWV